MKVSMVVLIETRFLPSYIGRICNPLNNKLQHKHLISINLSDYKSLYSQPVDCKSAGTIAETKSAIIRKALQLLLKLNVLYIKLQIGLALPGVVFQMIADAERLAVVDTVEEVAFLEGNARKWRYT